MAATGEAPRVKNLKTYLFISTRNLTLNYLEKNKVRDNYILSNPEITQQDYNPEDQLVSKKSSRRLIKPSNSFRRKQRWLSRW